LLLVVGEGRATLLGQKAEICATAEWRQVENEWPITGWLPNGEHFFVVTRASKESPTEIRFYRARDARASEQFGLDPGKLVPWDAEPYTRLRRDFWSLELSDGTGAVGSLLDTWHDFRYDAVRGELSLGTYRPVSAPFSVETDWGKEWMCRAEEHWITVDLRE
jgi:hypothetical protein